MNKKVKNIIDIVLKVILCLLIVTPILGALGIFPAPTRELYNTDAAFNFISTITSTYVVYLMALVFAAAIVLIIMRRTALAALLILPITVCILCFHAFLDGGLFTGGAVMGIGVFLLNIYFLWQNKERYSSLLDKDN